LRSALRIPICRIAQTSYSTRSSLSRPELVLCVSKDSAAYVGYNCKRDIAGELVWQRNRFFYHTRKHGRDFLWWVIMDEDDAAWTLGLWRGDKNFRAWLEELGLELDD